MILYMSQAKDCIMQRAREVFGKSPLHHPNSRVHHFYIQLPKTRIVKRAYADAMSTQNLNNFVPPTMAHKAQPTVNAATASDHTPVEWPAMMAFSGGIHDT